MISASLRTIRVLCIKNAASRTTHASSRIIVAASLSRNHSSAPPDDVTLLSNVEGSEKTAQASLSDRQFPGVLPHKDGNLIAMYTCKVCDVRSARMISKRAFEHGVVLLRCPGCQNLHLLADHLDYFGSADEVKSVWEAHGEAIRRGALQAGEDGNVVGLLPQDLQVLASTTKSVRQSTGEEVK
jgi:hypothetical protein